MLIIKAFINYTHIDAIYIHKTGKHKGDVYEYEIMNRKTGERLVPDIIKHKRADGYRRLLIKVLILLEMRKEKEGI